MSVFRGGRRAFHSGPTVEDAGAGPPPAGGALTSATASSSPGQRYTHRLANHWWGHTVKSRLDWILCL